MNWYLIYTKPRQEQCASLHLTAQGYTCYLPLRPTEKLRRGRLNLIDEPLFTRYLFILLGAGSTDKAWGPIRSTRGVSRLVTFGLEPARVDNQLIEALRDYSARQQQPQRFFTPGQRVLITDGIFAGIEALYQMDDGESRAMVLLELISKPVAIHVAAKDLSKVN